jgi:hypothetical protein
MKTTERERESVPESEPVFVNQIYKGSNIQTETCAAGRADCSRLMLY